MFKIVQQHCKKTVSGSAGSGEDEIHILDNQEETSLSSTSGSRYLRTSAQVINEDDEDTLDTALEDLCVIEEHEYVHPDTDDYLEEEDEEEVEDLRNEEIEDESTDVGPRFSGGERGGAGGGCGQHRGVHKLVFGVKKCLHSRPCSICVYLCLTLVVLASLVSLVVISVLIVVPYTKAATYVHSNCTPVGVSVDTEDRRCSCGKGCSSLYTCVQIRVHIAALNYTSHPQLSSILYENEAIFMRKCSYYPPCKSSKIANDKSVRNYQRRFGVIGHSFPCLYNPGNPREVIRTRRFHLDHVLHGTVWSSLICVVSSCALVLVIRKRGCVYV